VRGRASRSATTVAVAVVALCWCAAAFSAEPRPAKPAPSNSAAAQYGRKVAVCAVTATGKQHTIRINSTAVPPYLATHPKAHEGTCTAGKPRNAKANVCIKLTRTRYAPVWIPTRLLKAYLHRNAGSFRTKTGKCVRRR